VILQETLTPSLPPKKKKNLSPLNDSGVQRKQGKTGKSTAQTNAFSLDFDANPNPTIPSPNTLPPFPMPPSPTRSSLTLIVAATSSNGIGLNGGLPWRLPEEMKYFANGESELSLLPFLLSLLPTSLCVQTEVEKLT